MNSDISLLSLDLNEISHHLMTVTGPLPRLGYHFILTHDVGEGSVQVYLEAFTTYQDLSVSQEVQEKEQEHENPFTNPSQTF